MTPKSSITSTVCDAQPSVLIAAVLRSRTPTGRNVPVEAGLCVPKGRLRNATAGRVDGFDQTVAAQFEVLNRWNDGSVRWLLASFVAPLVGADNRELGIIVDGSVSLSNSAVTSVKCIDSEIRIVSRDVCSDPPQECNLHLAPRICDRAGNQLALLVDGIREEVTGPVRQVFVISARIKSMPFVTLQLRLTHWTSVGLLLAEIRIRNTRRAKHSGGLWDLGDSGSLLFRSLEISVRSDEIPTSAMTHWTAERLLPPRSTMSEVVLQQFGSGRRSWTSLNHVTATGMVEVLKRGYEVSSDAGVLRGHCAEPTFLVEGDGSCMAVAVPEFWQQFPGSVSAAMGMLEVGIFPALANVTHELQGGEQKTRSFWIATGDGPGAVEALDWVHERPRLVQSSVSIAEASVLPWFREANSGAENFRQPKHATCVRAPDHTGTGLKCCSAECVDPAERLAKYLNDATSGRHSLEARRDSIDEYGWRNFGECPADHEQAHYPGSNTIISHYNNQFDMILGGILQFAASGEPLWFDAFDRLARHVMDIDIYHTNADRAAFNGGLFWHTDHYVDAHRATHRTYSEQNQKPGQSYGGGPSCEHNYTTGLLHYYFLTGHPEAQESVLRLAEWVMQMDDGRNTIFGLLDDGPTGAASATVHADYHGPGRGAGNSINALLDAWLITGSNRCLGKLEELIRRCVHPSQNPGDLHLLDAEGHWSYTVFLTALGRYLLAKRDADLFDSMYSYARDVMKTYGRWMAANERRTLDHPQELQYPTEAWAAQDFRKANVLRIAASCEEDASQAAAMRTKADLINDAAWHALAAFGDARLTARCLSILMTEGQREVFHRTCEPSLIPSGPASHDFGPWAMFVPQQQRIRRLFKSPVKLLIAAFRALHPGRCWRTWSALRRQL